MLSSGHIFETGIVELVKTRFSEPVVFGGFLNPGLVGPVAAGYMVEKLNLQEIAHVRSQHIPPVAVFIGAKLRHPFRIYSDVEGKILVILCETPIEQEGMYEISSILVEWFQKIGVKEVVVLEGMGVSGVPEDRSAVFVADDKKSGELLAKGLAPLQSALIGGVGGSILNQCLTKRVTGISLMTRASVDIPDPGAALSIIDAINKVYALAIPTDELQESTKRLNEQLGNLADQYRKMAERPSAAADKRVYG